ncbi:glycosyltransferase [Candidatus Daviesbacteria bacterium]|nr:glycosyltransferase [Candidatus Daviesbacteria bacterium]
MSFKYSVALVHDDLIQAGGAEKVFLAISEIYPQAKLFTSIANDQFPIGDRTQFQASFMQKIPLAHKLYRLLLPLYPLAFESFDLSGFNIVISSSSRFAHGVITHPDSLHVWYCYSPARYLYFQKHSLLIKPIIRGLEAWDQVAANRPDKVIVISNHVADSFEKVYGKKPDGVVYPFVNWPMFQNKTERPETLPAVLDDVDFFLIVSRLVAWKKIELAIIACNNLRIPLVIAGTGPDASRLKSIAGKTIFFTGYLTDEELVWYYQHCQALVMTQEEDFGMVALEAQASGRPVVAYLAGGAKETIIDGKTGYFFYPQTGQALADALKKFNAKSFDSVECRDNALNFSKEKFLDNFNAALTNLWHNHQTI